MDDETLGGSREVVNWKDEANCKGRGYLMFPKKHKDITYISEARRICRACSVRPECLAYALDFPAARGVLPTKPTIAEFMADMLRYYKEQPTFRDEWENDRKESY